MSFNNNIKIQQNADCVCSVTPYFNCNKHQQKLYYYYCTICRIYKFVLRAPKRDKLIKRNKITRKNI